MVLRTWSREDVDALHALWTAPEVRRFLWDDVVISRDTVEKVVESHFEMVDRYGIGFWALEISDSPVAGFSGFRLIDGGSEIELLFGLRGQHWGRGLAMEACRAALTYLWGSTNYKRVYARTDPPNERSVRVTKRLGMTHVSSTASLITYSLRRADE